MSVYHIDEASIDVPEEFRDMSVNIFSAATSGETGIGLVIARDHLSGMTFDDFIAKNMKGQSQKLRSYQLLNRRSFTLASLPAVEVKIQWLHDAGTMFHHIVYVEYYDKVVTFTLSSYLRYAKESEPVMARVLSSVKWRRR